MTIFCYSTVVMAARHERSAGHQTKSYEKKNAILMQSLPIPDSHDRHVFELLKNIINDMIHYIT